MRGGKYRVAPGVSTAARPAAPPGRRAARTWPGPARSLCYTTRQPGEECCRPPAGSQGVPRLRAEVRERGQRDARGLSAHPGNGGGVGSGAPGPRDAPRSCRHRRDAPRRPSSGANRLEFVHPSEGRPLTGRDAVQDVSRRGVPGPAAPGWPVGDGDLAVLCPTRATLASFRERRQTVEQLQAASPAAEVRDSAGRLFSVLGSRNAVLRPGSCDTVLIDQQIAQLTLELQTMSQPGQVASSHPVGRDRPSVHGTPRTAPRRSGPRPRVD